MKDSQKSRQPAQKRAERKKSSQGFQAMGSLFDEFEIKEDAGYITQEFQDYGYRLAVDLDDLEHKGLYIKLAKEESRGLLEKARSFVIDSQAKNKGALFMWKLKQLKEQGEQEEQEEEDTEGLQGKDEKQERLNYD